MINLEDFVRSIQSAADAAAQTVMDKNIELLDRFFDEAEPTDKNASVSDTKVVSSSVIKPTVKPALSGEAKIASEVIQKAAEAVYLAAEALKKDSQEVKKEEKKTKEEKKAKEEKEDKEDKKDGEDKNGEDKETKKDKHRYLKPKMVSVQYPKMTKNGPQIHTVHVPLISLVPISQIYLSELKFKVDLELGIVENNLQISFPAKKGNTESCADGDSDNNTSVATLEICINTTTRPVGMNHLIEGFDRALRAQIPG